MWSLSNHTDYAAERSWIRDQNGAEVWIVAVKATYEILPDGSTRLADEQVPVNSGPVAHPAQKSLRYESDLGPPKAATDIILAGHAFAQSSEPVKEIVISFKVGALQRSARVIGKRTWRRGLIGLSPSKAEPFLSMPLRHDLTFGGDDPESKRYSGNPLGCGAEKILELALPNIEPVKQSYEHGARGNTAVIFGPIPNHWPARMQYAGTYDQRWQDNRQPLAPLDLDPRYWQIAPAEQQVAGRLKGGETILLENLTPAGFVAAGKLAFILPKLSLDLETRFFDGSRERSRPVIHTLILEPDTPRFSVVYHAALPCHAKVNLLDRTIIREKNRPLDAAHPKPVAPAEAEATPAPVKTGPTYYDWDAME